MPRAKAPVAFVTGAAHGIGCAIAQHLLGDGWRVGLVDLPRRRLKNRQHPAGRAGQPRDIAETVAFLLDGACSGFITGANVVVDGGMTRKMIYVE